MNKERILIATANDAIAATLTEAVTWAVAPGLFVERVRNAREFQARLKTRDLTRGIVFGPEDWGLEIGRGMGEKGTFCVYVLTGFDAHDNHRIAERARVVREFRWHACVAPIEDVAAETKRLLGTDSARIVCFGSPLTPAEPWKLDPAACYPPELFSGHGIRIPKINGMPWSVEIETLVRMALKAGFWQAYPIDAYAALWREEDRSERRLDLWNMANMGFADVLWSPGLGLPAFTLSEKTFRLIADANGIVLPALPLFR